MRRSNRLPVEELEPAAELSAFRTVVEGLRIADALAISGSATSFPSVVKPAEAAIALLAMALGSNFPAYGTGEASPLAVAVAGDFGDSVMGDAVAFLSISSRRLRVPPAASSSLCLRALSAACFCFQASTLASFSAFFSSSVGAARVEAGWAYSRLVSAHKTKKTDLGNISYLCTICTSTFVIFSIFPPAPPF